MKLTSKQQRLLDSLAKEASPLSSMFFRSVEFRWMHPDDVIGGAGALKLGGRFAPIGAKAVYASDSEETLLREVSGRKGRLGGNALIDVDRYPRVTFRIDVKVDRHVSFAGSFRQSELERIRRRCLSPASLAFSQNVGRHLEAPGVQAILYSSVTGAGANVVVFVRNTKADQVVIFNRARVIAQIARLKNS